MRLPDADFSDRPWRIHDLTADFEVEDVWRLPTPGGGDDLARFARGFTSPAIDETSDRVTKALFAIRWRLGELFGWDAENAGVDRRVVSLRERLPDDLRDGERGPDFSAVPFRSVYLTDDEWVAELANRTVHALLHVGWVGDGDGGFHGELTALVKPNGRLGRSYMAAIKPIRRTLVYPRLLRSIGSNWPRYR